MRIAIELDLGPLREEARHVTEAAFSMAIGPYIGRPDIHRMKLDEALGVKQGYPAHPAFQDEAKLRGITAAALADLVIGKVEEQRAAVLGAENQRLARLAFIAQATTEADLRAFIIRVGQVA